MPCSVTMQVVSGIVASSALGIPHYEYDIHAPDWRSACALLAHIGLVVCQQPGGRERIIHFDRNMLWIRGNDDGDIRKIYARRPPPPRSKSASPSPENREQEWHIIER